MSINFNQIVAKVVLGTMPSLVLRQNQEEQQRITGAVQEKLGVHDADIVHFESSEGVEVLRAKIKNLGITPGSKSKLFFIDDADNLNEQEANTLLKTLEEPPSFAKIILFAASQTRILPTVRSRCQKVFSSEKAEIQPGGLYGYFKEKNFSHLIAFLKTTDNEQIKPLFVGMLDEMKEMGLNKEESKLYKRAAENLIKINCTNVNQKLILEEMFIWWKAQKI
jgi:hypothetical protein